jgi:hypothetical protein
MTNIPMGLVSWNEPIENANIPRPNIFTQDIEICAFNILKIYEKNVNINFIFFSMLNKYFENTELLWLFYE